MKQLSWSPKNAVFLTALLTFALYVPALFGGFVSYDDSLLIYKNPNVLSFSTVTLKTIFTTYDPELYIPITLLTYQIEHALFGLNPFVFHLTSVLLHVLCVMLVFGILRRLSTVRLSERESLWIAFVGAMIFAWHPLNTEAAAWLAARKDLLASTFCFASWLMYIKYTESERRSQLVWSIVLYALGLGSKVSIIMLPAALLLTDYYVGRTINRKAIFEKIPYAIPAVIFGIIAVIGKVHQLSPLTQVEQLFLGMRGAIFYLSHFFVPVQLSILHPESWPIDKSSFALLSSLVLGLGLIAVAALTLRKNKLLTLGIGFYFLMLLPTFATFWKNGFIYFASERYPYVALVGIIFLLCTAIVPFSLQDKKKSVINGLIFCLIMMSLGTLSFLQIRTWKDSETLLRHTLKFNPTSAHAMNNLGTALYEKGQTEEALSLYDQALSMDPNLPQVHGNRGLLLLKLGKKAEAEAAFKKGIAVELPRQIIENDLTPDFLLAEFLFNEGRSIEGMEILEHAVERGPDFFASHHNLAIKYQQMGRLKEAQRELAIALQIKSKHLDALYRFAAVSAELGQLREAKVALERIVDIDPRYEDAAAHLERIEQMIRQ